MADPSRNRDRIPLDGETDYDTDADPEGNSASPRSVVRAVPACSADFFAHSPLAAVRRSVRHTCSVFILLGLITALLPSSWAAQSLAEVARKEAERRRELDRQGVEARVIDGDAARLAPNGNLSTSSATPSSRVPAEPARSASRERPRSYRTRIQKLDRETRSAEARIAALRERLRKERWALPKVGRLSKSYGAATSQERLLGQIRDLESKVKQLRQERREAWDEGRRAGFQPGELDGKGVTP